MTTEKTTSRIHPELLKLYRSNDYRKRIKKSVELVKTLRAITGTKIDRPLPPLKHNATQTEIDTRAAKTKHRLDIDTIHYFAQPMGGDRSEKRPKNSTETT